MLDQNIRRLTGLLVKCCVKRIFPMANIPHGYRLHTFHVDIFTFLDTFVDILSTKFSLETLFHAFRQEYLFSLIQFNFKQKRPRPKPKTRPSSAPPVQRVVISSKQPQYRTVKQKTSTVNVEEQVVDPRAWMTLQNG